MADEQRKNKQVKPHQQCPRCGGWADPKELAVNGGWCNACVPGSFHPALVGEFKVVRDGQGDWEALRNG